MPSRRSYRRKSSRTRKSSYRKSSSRKSSRKNSRKSSSRTRKGGKNRRSRIVNSPCAVYKRNECGVTDKNCHYIRYRGCARRPGVISQNLNYNLVTGTPAVAEAIVTATKEAEKTQQPVAQKIVEIQKEIIKAKPVEPEVVEIAKPAQTVTTALEKQIINQAQQTAAAALTAEKVPEPIKQNVLMNLVDTLRNKLPDAETIEQAKLVASNTTKVVVKDASKVKTTLGQILKGAIDKSAAAYEAGKSVYASYNSQGGDPNKDAIVAKQVQTQVEKEIEKLPENASSTQVQKVVENVITQVTNPELNPAAKEANQIIAVKKIRAYYAAQQDGKEIYIFNDPDLTNDYNMIEEGADYYSVKDLKKDGKKENCPSGSLFLRSRLGAKSHSCWVKGKPAPGFWKQLKSTTASWLPTWLGGAPAPASTPAEAKAVQAEEEQKAEAKQAIVEAAVNPTPTNVEKAKDVTTTIAASKAEEQGAQPAEIAQVVKETAKETTKIIKAFYQNKQNGVVDFEIYNDPVKASDFDVAVAGESYYSDLQGKSKAECNKQNKLFFRALDRPGKANACWTKGTQPPGGWKK